MTTNDLEEFLHPMEEFLHHGGIPPSDGGIPPWNPSIIGAIWRNSSIGWRNSSGGMYFNNREGIQSKVSHMENNK
jgi:hypothetical protein